MLIQIYQYAANESYGKLLLLSVRHVLSVRHAGKVRKSQKELERVKNNVDALFFTPDVFAAGRPKHPVIPSEKTPSRISPRVPLLRAAW